MTLEAANALLKALEEPQGRTLFVLTSDHTEMLLPTIISRCVPFRIPNPEFAAVRSWIYENLSGTNADLTEAVYQINPKGTTLSKLTGGGKKVTVKWKKQTKQVSGYQIQYGTKKDFSNAKKVTVSGAKTVKKVIKSLKAKKYYYVRIRTYKTVSGKKYYSSWSKYKKVKTK